jgi:hypothetical protein
MSNTNIKSDPINRTFYGASTRSRAASGASRRQQAACFGLDICPRLRSAPPPTRPRSRRQRSVSVLLEEVILELRIDLSDVQRLADDIGAARDQFLTHAAGS